MAVVLALGVGYGAHSAGALAGGAAKSSRPAATGRGAAATGMAATDSGQDITGGSVGIPWTPPGTSNGNGDTWYNTWADDGNIYATSDDSNAYNGTCHNNFVVNELTGADPSQLASPYANCMTGYGGAGALQNYNDGRTWKTDGVISVDGTLYVVVARQVDGYGGYPNGYQSSTDASIIKSTDHGRTWSNAFGSTGDPNGAPPPVSPSGKGAKAMFPGSSFGTPVFINYGQDDNAASTADGGGQYVYAISNDGWAYDGNYEMLGRVPRSKISDLNAADWQFYTGPPGGDGSSAASWSSSPAAATHVISAAHQLGQSGVQYVPALHRYVLTSFYYPFNAQWPGQGQTANVTWSFYQAPHPWGPWTRFFNAPTVQCYMLGCDPASASPIGLYDPVPVPKFANMDGLSDVIFATGDYESSNRSNDVLYRLHAFPFTLTTTAGHVADDFGASYTGNWAASYQQGGYYDGTIHDTSAAGASASYTFTGNAIAWVGGRANNHGYAAVSVDGGTPTMVNTYAPQQEKQQVLFADYNLSSGKHTIKITVASQKGAAALGTFTDIDAFIVGGSGQSAPIQVSPAGAYMGAWPDPASLTPGTSIKETIELNNGGGTTPLTASWKASVPGGAVTVSPASGSLTAAAGQTATATVTLSAPQNAAQTAATMTLSATTSDGAPVGSAGVPVNITSPLHVQVASFAASPNTAQPGQQATFQVQVRNAGSIQASGNLAISGPSGWTVTPAAQSYNLAPGAEKSFTATTTNPGTEGQDVTFTASADVGGQPGDQANATLFTGHLRCNLGDTDQPVWHADPGYSCTLDQGFGYYDPNHGSWLATAPANYCWCQGPPQPLLFHVTVPAGMSGTLRLFLVDGDNNQGGRVETVYVDGQNLGTFSNFQQGKWVTADLTSAQTASGRINVEIDDARQGSNVVASEVDF